MTATAAPPRADEYVGEEMTLVQHLEELRQRLFKSVLAVAIGFAVGFSLHTRVLEIIARPYCSLPNTLRTPTSALDTDRCALIFTDPTGAFFVSIKAAAIVAIILAAPVVCYQIWRFVTPGLRPVERKYAIPFILGTMLLFAGGAVFSYFLIPRALEFLLGFGGDDLVSFMDANRYLTFVLQTMIAFGVAFEFPLVLILLSLMGVVTSGALRKHRRYALFGTFVAAAIITPTQDPVTMTFMAAPLVTFYEVSIIAARIIERRRPAPLELTA